MPHASGPPGYDPLQALSSRIAQLGEQVDALLADSNGDPASTEILLDELRRAEAERARLHTRRLAKIRGRQTTQVLQNTPADPAATSSAGPRDASALPVRERILAGLELLGVPAAAKAVAEAAAVRTTLEVDTRQVASLRRAEQASWEASPDRRPAYVVPALHHRRFEPLRGQLASSTWEPWRRIVGALSPRADHLRATIRLAEHLCWAREHAESVASLLEGLVWKYARSIPGALAAGLDPSAIVAATQAEFDLVGAEDRAERERAAERAKNLSRHEQLFGAGLRVVKEGGS